MTGALDPSGKSAQKPNEDSKAQKDSDEKPAQISEAEQATTPEENTSTAEAGNATGWGWGFDVNAVAGNIGGFFGNMANEDDGENNQAEEEQEDDGDDFGHKAASFANAATVELEIAGKAAQETIGKAAEEIGKGWGTFNTFLDDMLAAKPNSDSTANNEVDVHEQFRRLFPQLSAEDEIVDHFKCCLLQKYRCYLNNVTPEKSFRLQGKLFVSTSMIALYVTDDGKEFGGKPFGITIPFTDVSRIQKGAKSMLKLVTTEQISYIFAGFESDSHFSGALSLLEHMTAASAPQPETNKEIGDNKEVSGT